MARNRNSAYKSALKEEVKRILSEDQDLLKTFVTATLQQSMEAEMDDTLAAEKSERTSGRLGYRSGYYGRGLITRIGKIELRVSQDRQGRFRTEVFERYQRSEKALVHVVDKRKGFYGLSVRLKTVPQPWPPQPFGKPPSCVVP